MVTSYSLLSRGVQIRLQVCVLEFYWKLSTKIWMLSSQCISHCIRNKYFVIMALRLEVSSCSVKKETFVCNIWTRKIEI
jgi:hypothetical protein